MSDVAPDHWTVRLVVEMQVAGAAKADDAAKFAADSIVMGALGWEDAECQVFAVNDGKESGPFYRSGVYRRSLRHAEEDDGDGW